MGLSESPSAKPPTTELPLVVVALLHACVAEIEKTIQSAMFRIQTEHGEPTVRWQVPKHSNTEKGGALYPRNF